MRRKWQEAGGNVHNLYSSLKDYYVIQVTEGNINKSQIMHRRAEKCIQNVKVREHLENLSDKSFSQRWRCLYCPSGLRTCWQNIVTTTSALKLEAVLFFKTSVSTYKSTRHHKPDQQHWQHSKVFSRIITMNITYRLR